VSFDIIYGDFPWPYTSFGTAKLPYKCMTEEEIADFDFGPYMAKRCVLFLWTTCPKRDLVFRCVEVWKKRFKLKYLGVPYVWVKTKKDGTPIGASGPRPSLVKPLTEDVIALTNVKQGRTFPLLTEAQNQVIFAPKPPRGSHSRKPEEAPRRIVELLGDRPRIELFSREIRQGWEGHGDEYPGREWKPSCARTR
jgi:N6-adenosine-specific RNA methylase IME4